MDKYQSTFSLNFLKEDVFYFVENDIFRSKIFKIRIVNLPKIEKFFVKVIPPKYTGENNKIYNNILDLDILPQSQIFVKIIANKKKITSFFIYDQSKKKMKRKNQVTFTYDKKIDEKINVSIPVKIKLIDSYQETFTTDEFFINILEDQLPKVTVKKPNRDLILKKKKKKTVEIEANVEDDYGVDKVSLVYFQNKVKKEISLLKNEEKNYFKSTLVKHSFFFTEKDIEKFSKMNSTLSYYFKATDHGEGKNREGRSKIFFIEFFFKKAINKNSKKEPTPNQQTNGFKSFMRITDLILKWKKNIQSISRDWQNKKSLQEIKKKIISVEIEVNKRYNEAKGDYFVNFFPQMKTDILGTYKKSISEISNYLIEFNQNTFDQQFLIANQALRQLNITDTILKEYFPSDGSSQSTNQQNNQNEENKNRDLQQANQKIKELIKNQKKINKNLQQKKEIMKELKEQASQLSKLKII